MRTMGGLKRYMPQTRWTFLISTLAIAGIPGLSGYFSKDEILFFAFKAGWDGTVIPSALAYGVWFVGLVTALLTAVYMTRAYLLTFEGEPRWPASMDVHPHESPWTMTAPLWILAALAAVGGFLGLPPVLTEALGLPDSWIHHWLGATYGGPVAEIAYDAKPGHGWEWGLLGLGALIAFAGVGLAWFGLRFGAKGPSADRSIRKTFGGLYTAASKKWLWDEAYDATIVNPVVGGSRNTLAPFDRDVVDGAVNGLGRLVRRGSGLLRGTQTGIVQQYALAVVLGVVIVVGLILFV
jgi:NADH-quinone oxidoreductase subunit L